MTTRTTPRTRGLIRELMLEVQTRDPQRRPPTHDDVIAMAVEAMIRDLRRGGAR